MYTHPLDDTIAQRHSCRSFTGVPLSQDDRSALEQFLKTEATGPDGSPVRLALVDRAPSGIRGEKLGTYGVISGALTYLAGAFPLGKPSIEDYGYAFEKVVLYATERGLGSCWLAGTFDRRAFGTSLLLADDEVLPAVCPVGYPARKPTVQDSLMRGLAGSRRRKSPSELFFDAHGLPLALADTDPQAKALEAVRWAPSASNRQPWRLVRTQSGFDFYLKRTPAYGAAFNFDLQRMDIGIAMCHFELSSRAAGINGRWHRETEPRQDYAPGEYVISWIEG